MGMLYQKHTLEQTVKNQHIAEFVKTAVPDHDYYSLLIGAAIIALGGIITDSIPVVIASMIIAPLATPILGIGLGVASRKWSYAFQQCGVLITSTLIVLVISFLIAIILQQDRVPNILISFNSNLIIAFLIAVVAGVIAALGTIHRKIASAAAGVAIAVSLMPPLVATGVGLVPGGSPFIGSLELYLMNVVGITLASSLTFKWANAKIS